MVGIELWNYSSDKTCKIRRSVQVVESQVEVSKASQSYFKRALFTDCYGYF